MRKKFKYIAGVDEVGRGALCGPVVASCVCFKRKNRLLVRDSKQLSPKKREELFPKIKEASYYAFGLVREDVIDRINIFWATQQAFLKAITGFLKITGFNKEDVLFIVDGPHFKYPGYNVKCMIGADRKVRAVSAASILAKVLRDRIIASYDTIFSGWNLAGHKGYSTREHRVLIKQKGVSLIHRMSFDLGL